MSQVVKLYSTHTSPFALRIVWALKLKGIDFETIYEDLANKSPSLLHYNPIHKQVPVFVHNGRHLCESLVILEYIDETWKVAPFLLPEDPHEKAMARFLAKFNDEKLLPSLVRFFLYRGKDPEEDKAAALENMRVLEEQIKGKKFFAGETIGYLDLVLGWLVKYPSMQEEACDIKLLDDEDFPLLSEWKKNFSQVPVLNDDWPDREKVIVQIKAMREAHLAATAAS